MPTCLPCVYSNSLGTLGSWKREAVRTCCQRLNSAFLLLNVSQTGEGLDPRSNYHHEINPLLG